MIRFSRVSDATEGSRGKPPWGERASFWHEVRELLTALDVDVESDWNEEWEILLRDDDEDGTWSTLELLGLAIGVEWNKGGSWEKLFSLFWSFHSSKATSNNLLKPHSLGRNKPFNVFLSIIAKTLLRIPAAAN